MKDLAAFWVAMLRWFSFKRGSSLFEGRGRDYGFLFEGADRIVVWFSERG
jgi:hypothetical protein